MKQFFFNMSLKYKIISIFFIIITCVASALGYYSFHIAESQIITKVSATNLSVIKVIDNNVSSMQRTISDWVTVFSLSSVVQDGLQNKDIDKTALESMLYSGTMASIMNQMLVTGNFDYLSLYGADNLPLYQVATDDSSGAGLFDKIRDSEIYNQTLALNGASFWFPLTDTNNPFITYNRKDKIGMTRIIRNTLNGNQIGFVFVGVNKDRFMNQYFKNLYDEDHGILILDQTGQPLLSAGKEFYKENETSLSFTTSNEFLQNGSRIVRINGEDLLLSYCQLSNDWRILYAVPLDLLTKELSSIKKLVALVILLCLLLSFPLMMFLSSFLTAPINKLLLSMKRFQNGHFEEKVEISYRDEIGQLSRGYNTMVANIKTLIDDAYILRLKEQEAELKALQSQINPHFLYNMLDTIFWEAESSGQERISEMVINLSRLFRLSLNRGKSFTSVEKEKELIKLYLSLQNMRFRDKLSFQIDIPEELNHFVILKLSLQPFIENALVHGIERKRASGFVHVTGSLLNGYLRFTIEDNGPGMDAAAVSKITEVQNGNDIYTSQDTGGYAIQNVILRLRHYYKESYQLNYFSEPGKGTRVELIIPAIPENSEEKQL
ncbi:sensor histidine kinase [Paenibacillus frigoriresistens]|uniref:sensor histidine kinase n=1 Tax=Paenibacillus alginolyticus TaxID=59839 RepID=UPI001566187C|nr:sensor histidine kinase [Paenibacillus frigoriresistens]NRF93767.1 sensor histidine kinase [Paenibacillus frigoriresistens]